MRCLLCSSRVQPHIQMSSCIVRVLGCLSVILSLLIWNSSWLIFNLNGMCRNPYHPSWLLKVVRYELYELASSRWMLQKPCLALSLEIVVALLSWCNVSSNVMVFQCSLMIALFISWGSRQICRVPLGLQGYVREETHSLGWMMGWLPKSPLVPELFFLFVVYIWLVPYIWHVGLARCWDQCRWCIFLAIWQLCQKRLGRLSMGLLCCRLLL